MRYYQRFYWLVIGTIAVSFAQTVPQPAAPATAPTPVVATHPATISIVKPQTGHVKAVSPTETYYRILCVLPLVGAGTRQDPVRPKYIPLRTPATAYHSGIIAWTQMPADDGKHAIVEIVATTQTAFQPILSDASPDVVVFQRGTHTKAQTEAGIQRFRKDFTLDKFPRAVAQ